MLSVVSQFASAEPQALRPSGPAPEAEPAPPAPERRSRSIRVALEWAILIITALAIAVLIKTFLFQAFYIPSDSMVPTLKNHDRVIVNKLSYKLHPVHRGDIVVFKTPLGPDGKPIDPTIKDLVKRVIGLPGETIAGHDGHIYIDGRLLNEPYLPKGDAPGAGFAAIKNPPNSYWVMGDNRSNSRDSRYFPEHFIRKQDIIGRAFVRVWPLDRLGIL